MGFQGKKPPAILERFHAVFTNILCTAKLNMAE
jgi:hypothetical protein